MAIVFSIGGAILSLFLLYIVIETGVRRGIDSSETNEMIQELLEIQKHKEKDLPK